MHLHATSAGASLGLGADGKSFLRRGFSVAGLQSWFFPLLEGSRLWSSTKRRIACAGRLVRPLLEGHRPAEGEVESFSVSTAARHCSCMPLPWWCVSRLEARADCGPPHGRCSTFLSCRRRDPIDSILVGRSFTVGGDGIEFPTRGHEPSEKYDGQ